MGDTEVFLVSHGRDRMGLREPVRPPGRYSSTRLARLGLERGADSNRGHCREIEAFVDDSHRTPHGSVPGSTAYEQAFRDRAFEKLSRETGIPVDELKR